MSSSNNVSDKKKSWVSIEPAGRDEMNLAEFPFASLRHRGDRRTSITHDGWIVDKDGSRHHQKWSVSGSTEHGLPTEFDERVYVALMAITALNNFDSRKVPFSVYQIVKIMDLTKSKRTYLSIEDSLKRLKGVTIYAEGAFWDNDAKEWVKTKTGFNIIDKYWLRYHEKDERIREAEGVPAYIIWSQDLWHSFQANYIKSLDLEFFYSLELPLTRRLYRFLDKRMRYQDGYEIDIFELASRLGMARYRYPSKVKEKLQPGIDELIEKGFLKQADYPQRNGYTRARFVRISQSPSSQPKLKGEEEEEQQAAVITSLTELGISSRVARRLAGRYGHDQILEKIDYLAFLQEKNPEKVKNPRGWLRRAIEENYGPPDGYKPREKREAEAAQRQREAKERAQAIEELEKEQLELIKQEKRQHEERLAQLQEEYGTTQREQDIWAAALGEIELTVPKATFQTLFVQTKLLSLNDGVVTISAPNKYAKDWLEHRLTEKIKRTLEGIVDHPIEDIRFELLNL